MNKPTPEWILKIRSLSNHFYAETILISFFVGAIFTPATLAEGRTWAALIAATIAWLAFRQARQAYLQSVVHNKLSVMPKLTTNTLAEFIAFEQLAFSVTLENRGLGPATIDSLEIIYEDKTRYPIKMPDDLEAMVGRYFGHHVVWEKCRFMALGKKTVMGKDQCHTIIYLVLSTRLKSKSELETIARKFACEIHYSSAYGDKFVFDGNVTD